MNKEIERKINELVSLVDKLDEEEKIGCLNDIKIRLHEISPFNQEPVDCVIWEKATNVKANDYNPNKVASPEMKLLKLSILKDGYTQPVVTIKNDEKIIVVDGFHRSKVCNTYKKVKDRVKGHLPITLLNNKSDNDLMSSTIRHNRARGTHGVVPMADIVKSMLQKGWTDEEVATELGMCVDELLRFKQNVGLPELFKDSEYSRAWVDTKK